ncbi:DUF6907 domain-containing protein [Streptomyces sp. NRRL F-5135]|uniref:DUF6907 domain-containing protein n=1 Tax=Streptomyces sp. NRRL F-5135 TaxID=1463858 RepID=UPI000B2CBC95|nr:hypothetical protein [Streptomyces sp. NRRL F-5135]
MSIVLPEPVPVPAQQPSAPSATPPLTHPSPCPSWCKERRQVTEHHFGPSATWHWSPQYKVSNPRPLDGGPETLLRAELVRNDEGTATGPVSLYVQAEGDIDLTADEADIFITQAQAWVDTLRALRRQMG